MTSQYYCASTETFIARENIFLQMIEKIKVCSGSLDVCQIQEGTSAQQVHDTSMNCYMLNNCACPTVHCIHLSIATRLLLARVYNFNSATKLKLLSLS